MLIILYKTLTYPSLHKSHITAIISLFWFLRKNTILLLLRIIKLPINAKFILRKGFFWSVFAKRNLLATFIILFKDLPDYKCSIWCEICVYIIIFIITLQISLISNFYFTTLHLLVFSLWTSNPFVAWHCIRKFLLVFNSASRKVPGLSEFSTNAVTSTDSMDDS